jgi:hypothetical protein
MVVVKPLVLATEFKPPSEELIAAHMKHLSLSREDAIKAIEAQRETVYVNDIYQVAVIPHGEGCVQLNIRRRDGNVIFRDWRHFQQIKNQLCGPECEGIELYPAESRKVDTANKYHLFVITNPTFRFPFGWQDRDVSYVKSTSPGMRQRPFAKDDTWQ